MPFFSYTKDGTDQNKKNAPISEYLKGDNLTNEGEAEDYSSYYSVNNVKAASLNIIHVPTNFKVRFPAIVTNYSEDFKPSFSAENVYGRMDAIQRYQNTSRTVSVTWVLPAYDKRHSIAILENLGSLASFLYPVYDKVGNTCADALAIRESPLLRVRFANLIQKNVHDGSSYEKNGLLVAPTTFNFAPVLETGFFFSENNDSLYPKEIKISMNFTVLHEETLGWLKVGNGFGWIANLDVNSANGTTNVKSNFVNFPWGSNLNTSTTSAPTSGGISSTTTNGTTTVAAGVTNAAPETSPTGDVATPSTAATEPAPVSSGGSVSLTYLIVRQQGYQGPNRFAKEDYGNTWTIDTIYEEFPRFDITDFKIRYIETLTDTNTGELRDIYDEQDSNILYDINKRRSREGVADKEDT